METPQYVNVDEHSGYSCRQTPYYRRHINTDVPRCVHVDVPLDCSYR